MHKSTQTFQFIRISARRGASWACLLPPYSDVLPELERAETEPWEPQKTPATHRFDGNTGKSSQSSRPRKRFPRPWPPQAPHRRRKGCRGADSSVRGARPSQATCRLIHVSLNAPVSPHQPTVWAFPRGCPAWLPVPLGTFKPFHLPRRRLSSLVVLCPAIRFACAVLARSTNAAAGRMP